MIELHKTKRSLAGKELLLIVILFFFIFFGKCILVFFHHQLKIRCQCIVIKQTVLAVKKFEKFNLQGNPTA